MSQTVAAAIISTIVTLSLAILLMFIFTMKADLPPNLTTLAQILAGVLASNFTTVVSYYVGSSASSKSKDNIINQITQK